MGFMKEFRDFAVRGNVMDLAIGVVIGTAFNKIVAALVDSVIMPLIGLVLGDVKQFSQLELGGIKVGVLIQAILDFIIIALVLFLIVKGMNRLKAEKVTEPPPPAPPTKTELLLEEIRNELRKK